MNQQQKVKYLMELEAEFCEYYLLGEYLMWLSICLSSYNISAYSNDFRIYIKNEAEQYCDANGIKLPKYRNATYWFKFNKQGLRQRIRIIRAIRKAEQQLLINQTL